MNNIIEVLKILIPIIVVIVGFLLQNTKHNNVIETKEYQDYDKYDRTSTIIIWIITIIISFFINNCIYVLIKNVLNNIIKSIYSIEIIFVVISFVITISIIKLIELIYSNKINQFSLTTKELYYVIKKSRLRKLVNLFFITALILIAIFAFQQGESKDIIIGCLYIIGSLFLGKAIFFPIDSFSYTFRYVNLIEVYLKDKNKIECKNITEKTNSYVLKTYDENNGIKECNYVEINKESIYKIKIKTTYYNMKEIVHKNE